MEHKRTGRQANKESEGNIMKTMKESKIFSVDQLIASRDYWQGIVDRHDTKTGCDYTNALRKLADRIDQLETLQAREV